MNLKKITALVLLSSIMFYVSIIGIMEVFMVEHDITSTVNYIVDGDTFDVSNGYRIRLADIDCQERYEIGYEEASYYLSNLIEGETVYLDVDDVYRWDMNGEGDRLVCLAYLKYNETHLLNVNKALVESGHAVIDDYSNSFRPNEWQLVVPMLRIIKYENVRLYSGIASLVMTVIVYLVYWRISTSLRNRWNKRFKKDTPIEDSL